MNDIQTMAARAALKKMTNDGYISICTINDILKMAKRVPPAEEYEILHTIHCVSFSQMEPELIRGLPLLLQRVLGGESLDLSVSLGRDGKSLKVADVHEVRRIG